MRELSQENVIQRSVNAISIRLPSGIESGAITMHNNNTVSEPYLLNIDSRLGTMRYAAPRRTAINYGAYIENEPRHSYAVWIPLVPRSAAQYQRETLFISEQFQYALEDNGYFYIDGNAADDRAPPAPVSLRISTTLLRAEQHSTIQTGLLTPSPAIDRYRLERYIEDRPWLAVDSNEARDEVAAFVGIANFYLRARAIYRHVTDRLSPRAGGAPYISNTTAADPQSIDRDHTKRLLAALSADAEIAAGAVEYALLSTTLLRAAGVPARIITGVYTDAQSNNGRRQAAAHYWNEFFLPGFGWLPMDSAMGDGMYGDDTPDTEDTASDRDARAFYFGNMDNARIAISKDIHDIPQFNAAHNAYALNRSYLLFSHQLGDSGDG